MTDWLTWLGQQPVEDPLRLKVVQEPDGIVAISPAPMIPPARALLTPTDLTLLCVHGTASSAVDPVTGDLIWVQAVSRKVGDYAMNPTVCVWSVR